MKLGILGPLLVVDDQGRELRVTAARQRVLLAALLVRANQVVAVDELVELVWDGAPPGGAARTVRSYMVRLRHAVGPGVASRISARDPGYRCHVGEDELDALRFEALCRRSGQAVRDGAWHVAHGLLVEALGLWRGAALEDAASQLLRERCVERWELARVQALEWRIAADVQLGRYEQVIPELHDLVRARPLREHGHAQLMLALAMSGRQGEALDAYRQARRVLVEELGIEPGSELRRLHERILAGERALVAIAHGDAAASIEVKAPPASGTASAVPRQLPAAPQYFIGRQDELDALIDMTRATSTTSSTVVISAIDGMGGIGKTALALHAAYRLAAAYPDGQIFLDLHGYTRGQRPRTAGEALGWLMRALDVPIQQIPKDDEQAAALYRQRLADTRTLIVLDNALDEAQVRPLLPGGGTCLVLITSRRRLKGLDDGHTLSLDPLSPPEAIALLRAVAGAARVPPDDPLAGELADLCGYLPLALRIAGALLRHRPAWSLEHLAEPLREQHRRIPALSDGERDLATVFDLSYASLDERHRLVWRWLGLIPGPDFDSYAAAALLEIETEAATGLLQDLVDHNLLGEYTPGRYRFHDLTRTYAQELSERDRGVDRDRPLIRLLDYYLYTAMQCDGKLARRAAVGSPPTVPIPRSTPMLCTRLDALAWMRREKANLLAAFDLVHRQQRSRYVVALSVALAGFLDLECLWAEADLIHRAALAVARSTGDQNNEAVALLNLARLCESTGHRDETDDCCEKALAIYSDLGDQLGQAHVLRRQGSSWLAVGKPHEAVEALKQAQNLYHDLGDRRGEASVLRDLGRVLHQLGDPIAWELTSAALHLFRDMDDPTGEADTLWDLGRYSEMTGDTHKALALIEQARSIYVTLGNRIGEANAQCELGWLRAITGDANGAYAMIQTGLAIYREVDSPHGQALANRLLGFARLEAGAHAEAADILEAALPEFRRLGLRHSEAECLHDLARAKLPTGASDTAAQLLRTALGIFEDLDNRRGRADVLVTQARIAAASKDPHHAHALFLRAEELARTAHVAGPRAAALEGAGQVELALGDIAQAGFHFHEALEIYVRMGITAATRVAARLEQCRALTPADSTTNTNHR